MTFYKQVSLDMTPQQMRKLAGGKPAQLTSDQIMSTMKKIYVHPLNFDKIMKAKKKIVVLVFKSHLMLLNMI